MKKLLFAVAFILSSANALAGEFCRDLHLMCPGPECYPQQLGCEKEREIEAIIRESEERAAAKKQREIQRAYEERQKLDFENSKREDASTTTRQAAATASAKKVEVTKAPRKSSLPTNAKWNVAPKRGWSCIFGFHKVGLGCVKDQ